MTLASKALKLWRRMTGKHCHTSDGIHAHGPFIAEPAGNGITNDFNLFIVAARQAALHRNMKT